MKRLLVLSGKGGTGKTTVSSAFVDFSKARAVADCDVDAPNLHLILNRREEPQNTVFFGGEKAYLDQELCINCGACQTVCRFDAIRFSKEKYEIWEYACEGCGVCAYVCPVHTITMKEDVAGELFLYEGEQVFSTAMLKMGRGNSGKLVTEVKKNMLKAASDAELAIIDGSPGIGCPVIASMSGMDLILIVAEPSVSGKSDLQRLVKTAGSFQMRIAVCVNKWDTNPEKTREIEAYCKEQGLSFVGKIPYDKTVSAAINAGQSVARLECRARTALLQIYEVVREELNI